VVHVNNGLHGWGYSEDEYAVALPQLIALIRGEAPRANLLWATTTPVRMANKLETLSDKTERVNKRNSIAAKLMAKESIPIDDLFAVVAGKPELYSPDGVHFNAKGNVALASQVADAIRPLLATDRKNNR
jgi:lysophospholipase L1-like esterase